MKKIFYLLVLAGLLWNCAQAKINGNTYIDDSYGFEISAPAEWKINTTGVKKRVLLLSSDEATEVGVDVMAQTAKNREAYDVAVNQFSAYDSWVYIAGRHLGIFERHGADSGFSVMYSKSVFGGSGREKKIIVQEYYFVKAGKVYILTMLTDSEHWASAKSAIMDALNSFRIY